MKAHPAIALALFLPLAIGLEQSSGAGRSSDDAAPTPHRKSKTPAPKKKSAEKDEDAESAGASAKATPKSKNRRHATNEGEDEASDGKPQEEKSPPSPTPRKRQAVGEGGGDLPMASPSPAAKKRAKEPDDLASVSPHKDAPAAEGAASAASRYAPSASIPSSNLKEFHGQPTRVQTMIEDALSLAKLNLTYQYGSDDPANGGMDCSGSIAYLLRQHGYKDVPRDASGQYVWARQHGQFFAVVSRKAGGFEFADLRPGDLMFWTGTYHVDRDPPITHTMLYLGIERGRGQQVVWGSSDGRTYDGKPRYGVSVFDFHMPKSDVVNSSGEPVEFIGYAHLPQPADTAGSKPERP